MLPPVVALSRLIVEDATDSLRLLVPATAEPAVVALGNIAESSAVVLPETSLQLSRLVKLGNLACEREKCLDELSRWAEFELLLPTFIEKSLELVECEARTLLVIGQALLRVVTTFWG